MTAVRLRESAGYGARLFAFLLGVTLLGGASLALGAALAFPELAALLGSGQADPTIAAAGVVLAFLGLFVLAAGYLGAGYKLIADAVGAGVRAPGSTETTADVTAAGTTPGDDATATVDESGPTADDEPRRAPGIDPEADSPTPDPAEADPPTPDPAEADPPTPDPAEADPPTPDPTEADLPTADPAESDQPIADRPEAAASESVEEWGPLAEADEEGVTAEYDEYGSRQTEGPPEPTPEEIAFGTSGEDSSGVDEPVADDPDDEVDTADEPPTDEPDDDVETVDESAAETGTNSVKPAGRNAPSDPLADRTGKE